MPTPNNYFKNGAFASTGIALTGASPVTATGSTVDVRQVEPGTLSAKVAAALTTSALTATVSWQVYDIAAAAWFTCASGPANAANTAMATGTGSLVTTTRVVPAPDAVYGYVQARAVITTGGSTTGTSGDTAAISYSFQSPPW